MKITQIKYYGGARQKLCRLGLSHLFLELQEILLSTVVVIKNELLANSAGVVREQIDLSFHQAGGWKVNKTGDIDWTKRLRYNDTVVSRIGVEVQVSGRSDLLARDIVHLRNSLQDGELDVGIIVVPSDEFKRFLTDRVASYSYAIKYAEEELREAQTYPIAILAIEHDSFGDDALPKKSTNRGKKKD